MKKLLKITLILIFTPILITLIAYQTHNPKDYCETAEVAKELYEEYTKKFGMTYFEYTLLSDYERLALLKKNTDYSFIKASYNFIIEAELKCIDYRRLNKWERFELDVYSGEYFK